MIVLTTSSQSLRVLAPDVTSETLHLMAVYSDVLPQVTESLQRRASQLTSTSTSTTLLVLAAPAGQGIVRNIEQFTAHNGTVTTATVTLKIVDGAVERLLVTKELLSSQSLFYEHGTGWQIV